MVFWKTERNKKVCSGMHHSYSKVEMCFRISFYTFGLFNNSILNFTFSEDGLTLYYGRTFYF